MSRPRRLDDAAAAAALRPHEEWGGAGRGEAGRDGLV